MSIPGDHMHDRHHLLHASIFNALDWIAMILMIVGGLNWGLVGAMDLDLVAALFGEMTLITRAVYLLVGLAALYGIGLLVKISKNHST